MQINSLEEHALDMPNLAERRCESLHLFAREALASSALAPLTERFGIAVDRPASLGAHLNDEAREQHLTAHASIYPREGEKILHLQLDLARGQLLLTDDESEEVTPTDLIGALSPLLGTLTPYVRTQFLYPLDSFEPITPLPIPFQRTPRFSEVRGVRLVKTAEEGDATLYEAILQVHKRPEPSVSVLVSYQPTLELGASVFVDVFSRCEEIARFAVIPRTAEP